MSIRMSYNIAIDSDSNGLLGPNGGFAPEGFEFQTILSILSATGAENIRGKV